MRYVLHPGYINSANDSDGHYIGGLKLASLYHVDFSECVYGDTRFYWEQPGDVHLYPKYNGDYNPPRIGITKFRPQRGSS